MEKNRVKLNENSLRELFKFIKKSPKYSTWKKLVEDVQISNTSLKAFRRGERTIDKKAFLRLLSYLKKGIQRHFLSKSIFLYSNWGAKKGGINSCSKISSKELKERMKQARSYIKRKSQLLSNIPKLDNLELCEFFGAMLGDGSSGKYKSKEKGRKYIYSTTISCNASKDPKYIKKLSYTIKNYFGVKPYIRINKDNTVRLCNRSKLLYDWLTDLNYPSRKKPSNFGLPRKILKAPTKNLNAVLRGLLDTDGHMNARKDENYKYPYVTITSYSPLLRKQIKTILRNQGLPAFIHKESVSIRGIKNTHSWFRLIGSSNPRILNKYKEFCETGKIIAGS